MCPKCLSKSTKKIGIRRGIQRYKCNDCDKKFQLKRRNKQLQKIICHKYIYKRQTLDDLASEHKRSISWVKKQIFEYEPSYIIDNPRAVNLSYTINSITIDGKRGLYKAFEDYHVQMCHFHQK